MPVKPSTYSREEFHYHLSKNVDEWARDIEDIITSSSFTRSELPIVSPCRDVVCDVLDKFVAIHSSTAEFWLEKYSNIWGFVEKKCKSAVLSREALEDCKSSISLLQVIDRNTLAILDKVDPYYNASKLCRTKVLTCLYNNDKRLTKLLRHQEENINRFHGLLERMSEGIKGYLDATEFKKE